MEKLIAEYFERLRFDRIKTHKNLSVVPLLTKWISQQLSLEGPRS